MFENTEQTFLAVYRSCVPHFCSVMDTYYLLSKMWDFIKRDRDYGLNVIM